MKNYFYLILFLLSFAQLGLAQVPSNTLDIGDNTASNKKIRARNGATNKPYLQWNQSAQKWQFSNDGLATKDFGSGSGGGGGGVNLLTSDDNPGFEDGTTGWTASGGSFTAETVSPLFGLGSGLFDASALNQTLTSGTRSVVEGIKGQPCLGAISYKYAGTSGDYKLQATDGTNVLSESSLDQTTSTSVAYVSFTCPSSGSVNLRVIAAVANPSAITLDGPSFNGGSVLLGSNSLVVAIGQASFYGSLKYVGATGCEFFQTSNTFGDRAPNNSCNTAVTTGAITAPATKVPQAVASNITPGTYRVVVNGSFIHSVNNQSYCRIIDDLGNVISNNSGIGTSGASLYQMTSFEGAITYTTSGARTFKLQCRNINNASNVGPYADGPDDAFSFMFYKFPTNTEQAVSVSTSAQSWTGYHASDCSWSTSSASFADFAADASCTFNQSSNTNFGSVVSDTSAGNKTPGIVFTPTKTGNYLVMATVDSICVGTTSACSFQMSANGTPLFSTSSPSNIGGSATTTLIGALNITSLAQMTLKIQGLAVGGVGPNLIGNTGTNNHINWSIVDISQNLPSPVLISGPRALLRLATTNGYGSTNTKVRRFSVVLDSTGNGTDYTYTDSAVNGMSISINTPGVYAINYCDMYASVGGYNGLVKNNSQGTTNIQSVTQADRLSMVQSASGGQPICAPYIGPLNAGDVIKPQAEGTAENANPQYNTFTFSKVSN